MAYWGFLNWNCGGGQNFLRRLFSILQRSIFSLLSLFLWDWITQFSSVLLLNTIFLKFYSFTFIKPIRADGIICREFCVYLLFATCHGHFPNFFVGLPQLNGCEWRPSQKMINTAEFCLQKLHEFHLKIYF
jgi:hypothetical protein